MLTSAIDRYVEHHRPILGRGAVDSGSGPLWLSSETGTPMPYNGVETAFRRITRATLGVDWRSHGPHRGSYHLGRTAPHLPGLASALLGHSHPTVTEQHYNRATAHGAAQAYGEVLRSLQSRAEFQHQPGHPPNTARTNLPFHVPCMCHGESGNAWEKTPESGVAFENTRIFWLS